MSTVKYGSKEHAFNENVCKEIDPQSPQNFLLYFYTPFLDAFSHLYKRVCPSVRPSVRPSVGRSVRHTRVEYLRNGPNLNKIASGIRNYAIKRRF